MIFGMLVHNSKCTSSAGCCIAYAPAVMLHRLRHFTCNYKDLTSWVNDIWYAGAQWQMHLNYRIILYICSRSHATLTLLHSVSMCSTGETFTVPTLVSNFSTFTFNIAKSILAREVIQIGICCFWCGEHNCTLQFFFQNSHQITRMSNCPITMKIDL